MWGFISKTFICNLNSENNIKMGFLVCKMLRQKILKYIQAKGINSLKLSILNFYVNVTCEMFFFSFPDSTFKDGPV
jgi:hypothetical protein